MDEYKEPSYKNMTITQVIDRLSDIADSAQYCEIEGILCRAIAMLKDYRSIDEFINEPMGATKGSAGYDFYSPLSFVLEPGETIKIPTGIRCGMNNDWVLMLFPRSGLGFKYRIRLENTVGIIDSDYFYSDNEGHIMVKITNEGVKTMKVAKGDGFCQGIFLPYGITEDDKTEGTRNGGFGSTDK